MNSYFHIRFAVDGVQDAAVAEDLSEPLVAILETLEMAIHREGAPGPLEGRVGGQPHSGLPYLPFVRRLSTLHGTGGIPLS